MRRFFIAPDQIGRPHPRLEGQDVRHIRTVLRLDIDDEIVLFDGDGAQFKARIVEMGRDYVQVVIVEQLVSQSESPIELVVAQGYLKEKKMDQLVRPLTELGVSRWIPVMAQRSIPAPDQQRLQARQERWKKLSQEAVKQCRRSRPMAIDPAVSFHEALQLSQPYGLKLVFWEKQTQLRLSEISAKSYSGGVFVMIGPEGGFDEAEIATALREGFYCLGLGPRILRAETATLAVSALIQYLFGDIG